MPLGSFAVIAGLSPITFQGIYISIIVSGFLGGWGCGCDVSVYLSCWVHMGVGGGGGGGGHIPSRAS